MSDRYGVSETVALLERTRQAIARLGQRAEALSHARATALQTARWNRDTEVRAVEAGLAKSIEQIEAGFKIQRDQTRDRHERRKAGLQRAYTACKKQGLARIDEEEGRRKYAVQRGTLEAERSRLDGLAHAESLRNDFKNRLLDLATEYSALEQQARKLFGGYRRFQRWLIEGDPETVDLSRDGDEHQLVSEIESQKLQLIDELRRFRRLIVPFLFRFAPLWIWLLLAPGLAFGLAPALRSLGQGSISERDAAGMGLALFVAALLAYFAGRAHATPLARSIANRFASFRRLEPASDQRSEATRVDTIERIENRTQATIESLQQEWRTAVDEAALARQTFPGQIETRWRRALERADRLQAAAMKGLDDARAKATGRLRLPAQERIETLDRAFQGEMEREASPFGEEREKIDREWREAMAELFGFVRGSNEFARERFPDWPSLTNWSPPGEFNTQAQFGRIEADMRSAAGQTGTDVALDWPGSSSVSLPLLLSLPGEGSILFETSRTGSESAIAALNTLILRLLAGSPPGKISFTIIDPIRLGQSFASIMHLADYEEHLIDGRIWTQTSQIEERLGVLNEHMEKVIQMYLRNEYETLAEYNAEAGTVAERYRFVVIADFPANFSATAVRRLLQIAASGARCGVYTLIHWDHRHAAPPDFLADELRRSSVCLAASGDRFLLARPALEAAQVVLEAPPGPELATPFLRRVGEMSRGSNRVEVPFEQVAPEAREYWTLETTEELRVPIGRSGASKLQYLELGQGTRQHVLIAGKTGSGKSTLFHVIVTNLALWFSPRDVEFYLIDFKKGVEFKSYASHRLPHARVVAIESDREFALSVLQRVDQELRRRGDLFRKAGAQDLAGYKRAGASEPLPRSLLIIDEFQEFFVEDDRISQSAAVLLDRIVRLGRAFGIHVLLGSQTLGGAYTLARTTMGQMVVRIALQCNEADSYLIMDESNAAPRLLSRPGEGIYNEQAGALQGNSPFQAVWLSDQERDLRLKQVRQLAETMGGFDGPVVFEGNAPADVRENLLLAELLRTPPVAVPPVVRLWLGAPNSIKGPTEIVFERRSGSNLLMAGQRDESVLAFLCISLVTLAAQCPRGTARVILLEGQPAGSPGKLCLDALIGALPLEVELPKAGSLADIFNALTLELKNRSEREQEADAPIFLFIHELQHFKRLRPDDEFAYSSGADSTEQPGTQLSRLISEGPGVGIHVIATVDTYNNVTRFLARKTISEFEMRVLFQMSANDSASLCDDPKASVLGLHRALLYNEQAGYLETFRPYAMPSAAWMETRIGRDELRMGADDGVNRG